jgi:hypothetical protein
MRGHLAPLISGEPVKFTYALPLLAASAMLLAGCSSNATTEPTPSLSVEPAQATATPSPSSTLVKNARGNVTKQIGVLAMAGGKTQADEPTLKFKVTSIEPITCDAPYATPPVGTAMAVAIEVETSADFVGGLTVNGAPGLTSFDAYNWKGYAANGTRMNKIDTVAADNCVADESRLLPSVIGKGEKATGIVILEVTSPTGSLAYDGSGMVSNGWEWEYPAK